MKTIIHIGQHKTGTTSIQHYLRSEREQLIENGLYVADTMLGFDNPSHFLLNVYALDEDRDSTAKLRLREFLDDDFFATLDTRLEAEITQHYRRARELGCSEILWTNEGLFLLNSEKEYLKLKGLFDHLSEEMLCVCCFRDVTSFREAYIKQLQSLELELSDDPKSYRYLEPDSWIFDYERKKALLNAVFEEVLILDYDPDDMVRTFMGSLGFTIVGDTSTLRLNVTAENDP